MAELEKRKVAAVAVEDYELAAVLKKQISTLKDLEQRKVEAVAVEDYELAAVLKKQIAALKAGARDAAPEMELKQGFGAAAGAAPEVAPNSAIEPFQDLPFDGYLSCPYFAKINTNFPGLQLIHESPYIFLVTLCTILPPIALPPMLSDAALY